jgi:GAF domain-containing protein
MPDASPLQASLAALSRFFVSDSTLEATLQRVSELCQQAVPSAHFVGITLMIEGRPRTAIYTDETSPEIDQAQYDSGTGPCLDAYRNNEVNRIESTLADGPWQEFRKAAFGRGILSTLSLPMAVDHRAVGALNLYSTQERGFGRDDEETASAFASHAAVVLANADAYWDARGLSQRLDQAMQSRAVIEQAKGILMARQQCNADEAFDILVKASQRENVKVRLVAARIVERASGQPLPPE